VLAAQRINIGEALSCYADTVFLLDESGLNAAMAVLPRTLK
jgi:hypothetical protein